MYQALDATVPCLSDRPRANGGGSPDHLVEEYGGVDMFDCVFPTRIAAMAALTTRSGGSAQCGLC